MEFSKYPEICHEKVMFQSLKSILSYLESFQDQIATQGFTLPWTPDFVDDCLVRLVYLIHDWTIPADSQDHLFFFYQNNDRNWQGGIRIRQLPLLLVFQSDASAVAKPISGHFAHSKNHSF